MIDLTALVAEADRAKLPALVAQLAAAQAAAAARLMEAPSTPIATEILDPDQASRLVGVNKRWLLEQTRGMSFRSDLGHRTKRFDKAGLLAWARTAIR